MSMTPRAASFATICAQCRLHHQHDANVFKNRAHCAPCGGGAPAAAAATFTVTSCPPSQWPDVEHEKWSVPGAVSSIRYGDASGPASSVAPEKSHDALGIDHTCAGKTTVRR
jgi:hypothetical protein